MILKSKFLGREAVNYINKILDKHITAYLALQRHDKDFIMDSKMNDKDKIMILKRIIDPANPQYVWWLNLNYVRIFYGAGVNIAAPIGKVGAFWQYMIQLKSKEMNIQGSEIISKEWLDFLKILVADSVIDIDDLMNYIIELKCVPHVLETSRAAVGEACNKWPKWSK